MREFKSKAQGKYALKDEVARTDIAFMKKQIEGLNQGEYITVDVEARAEIEIIKADMQNVLRNPVDKPIEFLHLANTEVGADGEEVEVAKPINGLWVYGNTIFFKDAEGNVHEIGFRDDEGYGSGGPGGNGGSGNYSDFTGMGSYILLSDYGLTQVEYVEFDGQQAINTNQKLDSSNFVFDSYIVPTKLTAGKQIVLGCDTNGNGTKMCHGFDFEYSKYIDPSSEVLFAESTIPEPVGKMVNYKIEKTGTTIKDIDGNTVNLTNQITGTYNINMKIGGFMPGGQNKYNYCMHMKLYGAKMYINDNVVREFIPCVDSDGTALLFDWVKREKYYSDTDVPLIAGPVFDA